MSAPPLGLTARATVERIIDGDTLVVSVQWPLTIRLEDCWAPELRGPQSEDGLAAKAYLQQLAPVGSQVIVSIDTADANSLGDVLTFGRVVASVWCEGAEESVSQLMVGTGMATASKQEAPP